MAALLLRQGRARALKTMLLEGPMFQGLAPAVSLSAKSGKSDQGLPPKPKKQSPPKDVVGPKERGRPLSSPAAARLPRHAASCGPPSPVPSRGGTVAIPGPDDSSLAADEGVPKVLSRKTLVEFPQKVPSALRERGSDAEALRKGRGAAGGSSPSSSSSSSSSSSESESDDEGGSSEVGSPGTRRGGGRAPTPEASRPLENRAPQMSVSAKAKARSPRPGPDLTSAEQPRGAEKPGTPLQPARGRKSAKPDPAAAPQGEEEFVKQSAKGEKQKMVRANRAGGDSRGPLEVRTGSSDQTRSGVAAQAGGGPAPTLRADQTATREWPRAAPGARARPLQRGPGPAGDAASAPLRTADAGPQVPGGGAEAPGETPEGRPPVASAKPAPVQDEGVFREEVAAPRLAAQSEATEDAAAAAEPAGAPGAPGPAEAAVPAEPFDNTTYKNLQHHDYNTYTFLDLNLNLSKFRLPQPSSGRESPRH
ncbi:NADH dehydrogenase [ubiquinone] flavoprotein 3, mitochondrial isoform X1 [Rousettus aegyptiacus]|uniref:NADH:ubiquinone oxidoreductase subunit V3 n=1 Tax=Rousettus aegyptiacus TaxID=9407 RepID=A0A7J8HTQ9_ROUAE|nr:NADH dehydrogenase [ubiquinone] flavoprotein 3, mitochondrial isoform X1 [Rousettus aegyptiacus]KAF6475371.1 NADH:ubiquinone oxidoreductase subunit V3 [Rousettus aegyptiacus]